MLATLLVVSIACAGPRTVSPAPQEEYRAATAAYEDDRARYADEVVACAAEEGIETEYTWDFGFFLPPGLESEEAAAFWDVVQRCAEAVYPPERVLSDEEIEDQYRLLLAARECLETEGFETSEPSGFASFLEAYRSEDTVPWSPFAAVADDAATFREAVTSCPQPGRF